MHSIAFTCLYLSLFFPVNLHASMNAIGKIEKFKGEVSKILSGGPEATNIAGDDEVLIGSTFITSEKSFFKIRLADNSEISIGPDSKIKFSDSGMLFLEKGQLRASISPSQNKNKFYVRTPNTIVGSLVADYHMAYNPDAKLTSLVSYKGVVGIVKIDLSTHQRFENRYETSTRIVTRDEINKTPEISSIQGKAINEKSESLKLLSGPNTMIISAGMYSNASVLQKVLPEQLALIFKNSNYEEKNPLNFKSGLSLVKERGGLIDFKTSFFIPADSSLNTGDFDAETGQYVAPENFALDAKQGFILGKNVIAKAELIALKEDLNKLTGITFLTKSMDAKEGLIQGRSVDEKYIRNRLVLWLGSGSETLSLNEDGTGQRSAAEVESNSAMRFGVEWHLASLSRFAPILGLSYAHVEFSSYSQDPKALFNMMAGAKYALTNRIDLKALVSLDQSHYANQSAISPDSYQFRRVVITNLNLGASFEIVQSDRWSLMSEVNLHKGLRKRLNNLVVSGIAGYGLRLTPSYKLDAKKSLGLGFFISKENATLTGGLDYNEQSRAKSGIEASFNLKI